MKIHGEVALPVIICIGVTWDRCMCHQRKIESLNGGIKTWVLHSLKDSVPG